MLAFDASSMQKCKLHCGNVGFSNSFSKLEYKLVLLNGRPAICAYATVGVLSSDWVG